MGDTYDSDDGVSDLLAEVALSNLLHLGQDHARNLLGRKGLLLALDVDADKGLSALVDDLVGEVLDVVLDILLGVLAADEALDVVDGVLGVASGLVLGG